MFEIALKQVTLSQLSRVSTYTMNRFLSDKSYEDQKMSSKTKKYYTYKASREILSSFIANKHTPINKMQVFFNFKGGTGKTSLCYQISFHFALSGYKVLVVDLDPQAHLSYAYGLDESDDYPTLYDVVVNSFPIENAIINLDDGLDIIPSNISLTRLELPLNQLPNREKVLSKIFDPLKQKYDFIFFDTNPTISTINRNATIAADVLNIVCETQPYSLKGLQVLVDEVNSFGKAMDLNIEYRIIANKYESKTVSSQEVLGFLRHHYKDFVFSSIIRRSEDINISAKKRLPVVGFCNKKSAAFEDINDITWEMLEKNTILKN